MLDFFDCNIHLSSLLNTVKLFAFLCQRHILNYRFCRFLNFFRLYRKIRSRRFCHRFQDLHMMFYNRKEMRTACHIFRSSHDLRCIRFFRLCLQHFSTERRMYNACRSKCMKKDVYIKYDFFNGFFLWVPVLRFCNFVPWFSPLFLYVWFLFSSIYSIPNMITQENKKSNKVLDFLFQFFYFKNERYHSSNSALDFVWYSWFKINKIESVSALSFSLSSMILISFS